MKVIIAAAGTGGHINPGIAIANKIKEKEPESEIVFFGTNRGLENDLVPRAGYKLEQIEAYGLQRKLSLDNLNKTCKTFKSISVVKRFIKSFNPDIVIGTGGYICVPVGLAAKKMKIPIVLHESNAYPGIAIKLLSKSTETIFLGFEDAKTRIKNAKKVLVTGTPTKAEKIKYNKNEIIEEKKKLGFINNDLPLVLIFGGSQGAKSINNALVGIIEKSLNKKYYQIIWAVGKNNYEEIKEKLKEKEIDVDNLDNIKVLPYIYNMSEIMNISDLIISRSGAMTVTEIEKLEKPAIFIPFPYATENHQEYNARALEKVNAARVILDKDLDSDNLDQMIKSLVINREKLKQMGINAEKLSKNNVENNIYEEIRKIIDNKS